MGDGLTPADILRQRQGQPWLVGTDAHLFWPYYHQHQEQLWQQQPQRVLLVEPHPIKFLAAFYAAFQQPCDLWLANPQWGLQEWQYVLGQCCPDLILGAVPDWIPLRWQGQAAPRSQPPRSPLTHTRICIATGGSSGQIRFAVHTWATLKASVCGFQQHFQRSVVDAYCVLPLFHVSGLMQAMRCWLSGGKLIIQPFRQLLDAGAITPDTSQQFLSLVPTQLQRLLNSDRDFVPWLRSCSAVLVGGAPLWSSLLSTARRQQLPLAPTYGMTETASQVTTLLPREFLAGQTGSGRPLPHAHIAIHGDESRSLPAGAVGRIAITAASLAPVCGQSPLLQPFYPGDLGYLDADGYLHVVGRQRTLIITGGEKVLPEEVEAALQGSGAVQDAVVLGIPDPEWGDVVVAVVVLKPKDASLMHLQAYLRPLLSPYKRPKHWLTLPALPRTPHGKLNRAALYQWVVQQLIPTAAATGSAVLSEHSGGGWLSQYKRDG